MLEPLTLDALRKAKPFLSVSAIADAAGMSRQSLHTRLRRGSPELTPEEAHAIAGALGAVGIVIRPLA